MRLFVIVATMVFLGACAAPPGPHYHEIAQSVNRAPVGMSRIVVMRPSWYGAAISVDLDINGRANNTVQPQSFVYSDHPPGEVVLSISSFGSPGRYTITSKVEPNNIYYFEISPRSSQIFSQLAFGLAGVLADSAVNENSGAYEIAPISRSQAEAKLSQLKLGGTVPSNQGLATPAISKPSGTDGSKSSSTTSQEPFTSVDSSSPKSAADLGTKLRSLKKLLDDGLISQSDYDVQKKRLLDQM